MDCRNFTAFFMFLFLSFSYSQSILVSGLVVDEGGNPLPGVTVLIEGTNKGTTTTFEGTYAIKAENVRQNIQFSYSQTLYHHSWYTLHSPYFIAFHSTLASTFAPSGRSMGRTVDSRLICSQNCCDTTLAFVGQQACLDYHQLATKRLYKVQ